MPELARGVFPQETLGLVLEGILIILWEGSNPYRLGWSDVQNPRWECHECLCPDSSPRTPPHVQVLKNGFMCSLFMFDFAVWDENDKQVHIPQIFSSMPPDIQEALRDSHLTSFVYPASTCIGNQTSLTSPPIRDWMRVCFMMLICVLSVSVNLTLPATGLFSMRVWGRDWVASEFKLLLRWLISSQDQWPAHDSHHVRDEFAGLCAGSFQRQATNTTLHNIRRVATETTKAIPARSPECLGFWHGIKWTQVNTSTQAICISNRYAFPVLEVVKFLSDRFGFVWHCALFPLLLLFSFSLFPVLLSRSKYLLPLPSTSLQKLDSRYCWYFLTFTWHSDPD